jgi:hypothetical protein
MKRVRIRRGSNDTAIKNTIASTGDRVRIGDTTVSKKELAWVLADIMTDGSRLAKDVVPGAVSEFIERQIGLRLAPRSRLEWVVEPDHRQTPFGSQVLRNMGMEPRPPAATTIAELAGLCEVELADDLMRRTFVVSLRLLDGRSEVMIPYEVIEQSTSASSETFRPFVEDLANGISNLLHNQLVVRIGRMVLQDSQRVGYGTSPERGRW